QRNRVHRLCGGPERRSDPARLEDLTDLGIPVNHHVPAQRVDFRQVRPVVVGQVHHQVPDTSPTSTAQIHVDELGGTLRSRGRNDVPGVGGPAATQACPVDVADTALAFIQAHHRQVHVHGTTRIQVVPVG